MSARRGLAWLGRHGSRVIALGVFIGLLLPPLASLLRPLLVPAIIGPFLIALLRLDWRQLAGHAHNPLAAGASLVWLLAVLPVVVHLAVSPLLLPPALHAGMVLMAAAAPLMASANLALMLGLDAELAVFVTVLATALVPFTLPPIALYLLDVTLDIRLDELMARLGLIVGGCFVAAWALRRFLSPAFAVRNAEPLDGLAVIGLLVFAIAIMDGVAVMLLAQPGFVLGIALAVYLLNIGLQALGALAFAWRGLRPALTMGLCSGNANLGILLAALADRATFEFVVFVAMSQFPIYTLPIVQRSLYQRWLAAPGRSTRSRGVMSVQTIDEVLDFWFAPGTRERWFDPSPELDQAVRARFGELHAAAAKGRLDHWGSSANGCLALCILLDQMPRNIFRGDASAFATDAAALRVAERALAQGFDRALPPERRAFLYLPFMHSETLEHQLRCVALQEAAGLEEGARFAREHLAIVRRFGRFPHRNAILGREATPEEEAYLREHPEAYGQTVIAAGTAALLAQDAKPDTRE